MLTEGQKKEIEDIVNESISQAKHRWDLVGKRLEKFAAARAGLETICEDAVDSKIPGYSKVHRKPVVDGFVALMADIRGSSTHLTQRISPKNADVTGIQRLFYETSALLPAVAKTVSYFGGYVTEYLGDGVLVLFQASEQDRSDVARNASIAAKSIIEPTRSIVNRILNREFRLPNLHLGVGIAYSDAMVTLVGLEGDPHPKVFGQNVYRASKLCDGYNQIFIDDQFNAILHKARSGNSPWVICTKTGKDFGAFEIKRES